MTDAIQELVNNGTINITNATNLAKLPQDEQPNFVDRAITMTPAQFVPSVGSRAKEIRDAKRQGRTSDGPKPFEPPVYLQKISVLKQELRDLNVGKGLINQCGLKDPVDVWKMAVSWTLHLDPVSIDVSRIQDEERKKNAEEAKAKKKQEREKKKAMDAATIAAGVTVSSEEDENEDDE